MNFQNYFRNLEKPACAQLKEKAAQVLGLRLLERSLSNTVGKFLFEAKLAKAPSTPVGLLELEQSLLAPQAAGVIHGDFEKGFIKAQVINYDDLIAAGSEAAAKAAGKLRLEGKDYVMQEGDVVEFRFNV